MITLPKSHSRSVGTTRVLLTQDQIDTCKSVAEVIRLCKKEVPDATNGEISRFLSDGKKLGEEGFVRPQWVFNVINNPPKGR